MGGDAEEDGGTALVVDVPTAAAGRRLDRVLVEALPGLSRRALRALLERGGVRDARGRRLAKGHRVVGGERLEVRAPAAARRPFAVVAEDDARVAVRLERADLVVLDKPAGLATVPLVPGERGTLAGVAAARYPEALAFDPRGAGLLQRLDRGTTGLVALARTAEAFAHARAVRRAGGLEKRYLAVVSGHAREGVLEGRFAADPDDRRRVVPSREAGARPARSRVVRVEPCGRGASLVELVTATGVRHQVRAQLAAAGHPLVGDPLYGGPAGPGLGRHALHASRLEIPALGLAAESPLPDDLRALVDALRAEG